jgi:DNA-binding FrmR family transcriptional regulator
MLSISSLSSTSSYDVNSDAYQNFLQKQRDIAKKNAAAVNSMPSGAQDQKALARQRVKEIKEQIEALRRMLMLFGGKDAKAVLQQLKQLASQLKQAAGVLKATPDASVPDVAETPTTDESASAAATGSYAEGRDAYAEQQAAADAEANVSFQPSTVSVDGQQSEDAKQLEAVTQALKALRTTVERMVKQQEQRG